MKDNLSIFVTMIVLVILVVIFPLYNHFERQDNMSYNLVLKSTANFIDEVINCGYIDQDMYSKYVSQIANTGNLYDIQLEAHKKIITTDTENTDIFTDQYIVDYNEDIFDTSTGKAKDSGILDDKSIKNGIYKLDLGDEIYIKVKNSSITMAEAMFKTIVPLASSKNITVNYGGIIKNNAWLKAESGVVAKELITLKFKIGTSVYDDWVSPKYLYNGESTVTFDIKSANEKVSLAEGEVFKGWIDENNEGEEEATLYTGDTIKVSKSMTLIPEIETPNPKVTLELNGGSLVSGVSSFEVTYNEKYGELPTPNKDGYDFDGWYLENGDKITSDSTVTINKNHKLYAYWKGNQVKVTFVRNGGSISGVDNKNVTFGDKYGTLPTIKKRTAKEFYGWYDSNGNKITSDSIVTNTSDHTLYARWKIIISLSFNGGRKSDGSVEKFEAISGGKYVNDQGSTLDTMAGTPKRENCTFVGWYTSQTGGTIITSDSIIADDASNHILYAHWKANSGYKITKNSFGDTKYYTMREYNGSMIKILPETEVKNDTVYKLSSNNYIVKYGKAYYKIDGGLYDTYILADAFQ